MRPLRSSYLLSKGVFLLVPFASQASAQAAQQVIRASFAAESGCGDRDVLEERFEARVPELQMTFRNDAPVQFSIERRKSGARARLLILLSEGGELSRTIETESCESAVEAIAFIAAVALDPGADDPLRLRSTSRLLPETATTRQASEAKPDQKTSEPPPSTSDRFWTAALYGSAESGAGPDFLFGGGFSLESASGESSLWAPSARLLVTHNRRGKFTEALGTAHFELTIASLDLCPSQTMGDIFRLQVCATMEGGILRAEGRDTFRPTTSDRPWAAFGLGATSEILLAGPVGLSYRGAAVFPVVRDTFQFGTTIFHEIPPVALDLSAGISIRF